MLQVEERSAIGNRADDGTKLHRRHRDALAERTHPAHTALVRGQFMIRVDAKLFARNVVASQFPQAELVGIVFHPLEAKLPSQRFEIWIDALRQRIRKIQAVAATHVHRRVLGDEPLGQGCQRDGELDGRTRLGTWTQRKFLVDHGEDSAVLRVDGKGRTVEVTQRLQQRSTYQRIFARHHVAMCGVVRAGHKRLP